MHHAFRRLAVATAIVAAAVPSTAGADPVTATIRVEGQDATLVPQTSLTTDARTFVDTSGVTRQLPPGVALDLLLAATAPAGIPIGCTWDPGYGDCFPFWIGAPFPGTATRFWNLVVNYSDAQVGSAQQPIATGDQVVYVDTDFMQAPPKLLDLSLSSGDTVRAGTSFTASVRAWDTHVDPATHPAGTATPAMGATVRYGAQVAVTDAAGQATLIAQAGTLRVQATATGAMRSQAPAVCGFADSAATCDPSLAPPPASPAPLVPGAATPAAAVPAAIAPLAGAAPTLADAVAPSSRITQPRAFARVRAVRRLGGAVAPDRSDVARVEYALARRIGTLCRFRTQSGNWAAPSTCAAPRWLPARGRAFWTVSLHTALAPGRYRAFSRATDGAGNVESSRVTGASATSFTVAR